jgi:alpha-L-rhamnosidase
VSTDGPTRYDSYYLGETYDARREIPGWSRAGFDDSKWASARVVDGPAGALRAQQHQPIRELDVRAPGARTEPSPGVFVYDVGQNLAGWAEILVKAPAGQRGRGLLLREEGRRRARQHRRQRARARPAPDGRLRREGAGEERWRPRFTYKGFQYVQLSGPGGAPLPAGVTAKVSG